jgi:hypothetical protein
VVHVECGAGACWLSRFVALPVRVVRVVWFCLDAHCSGDQKSRLQGRELNPGLLRDRQEY